jgi:SAM-dependent methyltransferase
MPILSGRQDAFGTALLEHLEGRALHSVIVEHDDGLIDSDFLVDSYFRDVRHWSKRERAAMRFVGGRALDVGCGAGRVALHLQTKGHDVVAVDVSRLAVKVSSMRGVMDARALAATKPRSARERRSRAVVASPVEGFDERTCARHWFDDRSVPHG